MKIFLRLALVAFVLILGACATTPKVPRVPVTYTGNKLIFPAVHAAFVGFFQSSQITEADLYSQRFVSPQFVFVDLVSWRRAKVEVTLSAGTINYRLIDMQLQDRRTQLWMDNSALLATDPDAEIYAKLDDLIRPILSSPEAYERAATAALNDPYFSLMITKPLNDVLLNEFTQAYVLNRILTVTAEVREVKEEPTTINGVSYKYLVEGNDDLNRSPSSPIFRETSRSFVFYKYHTNNAQLTSFTRGSKVSLQAKVARLSRGGIGETSLFFTFVDP